MVALVCGGEVRHEEADFYAVGDCLTGFGWTSAR